MKTARAIVIDEDREEALHLLQALGCAGIGAVYIAGDNPDLLPKPALAGIRVVFLDLKLINQPEVKQYIPYAVKVLKTCVRFQPRATGIICWTKHSDEIAVLEQELSAQGIEPAFLLALENKAALVASGSAGIAEVVAQLDQKLSENAGHKTLVGWEQVSHEATTESTDRLLGLSKNDGDLLCLLAAIASAAADESPGTAEHTLRALCTGLVSVHHDAVEDSIGTILDQAGKALHEVVVQLNREPESDADRENKKKLQLGVSQRAHLNAVLLTTTSDSLKPGNVYSLESGFSNDAGKTAFKESFVADVLGIDVNKKKDFVTQVGSAARIVGVEITPACDHAAQKSTTGRLVLGLLIRLESPVTADKLKLPAANRLFAKEIEPVQLLLPQATSGEYKMVLSARHFESRVLGELAKEVPLFRLRSSVVADIQAWFASHAARPGYVSIR